MILPTLNANSVTARRRLEADKNNKMLIRRREIACRYVDAKERQIFCSEKEIQE